MKLSTFDIGRIKALHFLLEEAHVGRAARHLGITPAAASNALRRLREDFGDPLLVRHGRSLIRTRLGNALRGPARDVVDGSNRLLQTAQPFDPATFQGELPIAMADHVAVVLLPVIERLVRDSAPRARLTIAPIPEAVPDWLERTGGVLVGPAGGSALAGMGSEALLFDPLYSDDYVAVLRAGHPLASGYWDTAAYARLDHILVTPRGRTQRSEIDDLLATIGLSRRITRVVSSFVLALPLVAQSDGICCVPRLFASRMPMSGLMLRTLPFEPVQLSMAAVTHRVHGGDAAIDYIKTLLRQALGVVLPAPSANPPPSP